MPITLSWSTYHIICKSNTFYLFNDVLHAEKSWHNCQYKKLPKTKCYNVVCKHHVQPSTNNMCIDCRKSADGAIERERRRSCIQVAAGTRQSRHVRHSCQTASRKQDGHEFPYLSYICPGFRTDIQKADQEENTTRNCN